MTAITLTIAGSDSGGGAGIQADLKTFLAFHVFGTSAITAITAQNTLGVTAVHAVPTDIVRAQIDAIVADLRPAAVKTGMLASAELVKTVATAIREHGLENYVLDPVMVASSGARLLDENAVSTIMRELLPLAMVVTPNLDEAEILTGSSVRNRDEMINAAKTLVQLGAQTALVKGGHLTGPQLVDVFYDGKNVHLVEHQKIDTRNTHGTGCTLSAAIAASLAKGENLSDAVVSALNYVHEAIRTAPQIGSGHGPLNHAVGPIEDGRV